MGEKVFKPYLLKNGAWDVDLAFVTHMHTDHYKGIEELCGKFRVRQTSTELLAGDTVKISEDVYVEILWPTEDGSSSDDENFFSRIYKVHVNGVSVLITGDITKKDEDALIRMYRGTGKLKDMTARTILSPQELPVGAITALTGAPFFCYVYFKRRRRA